MRPLLSGVLLLLLCSTAIAENPVELFTKSFGIRRPVANYRDLVKRLEGKTIQLSDGKRFRLGRLLGSGQTTVIYELADDPTKVIRLAQGNTPSMVRTNFIKSTREGYPELERYGAPVVRLFEGSEEYVIAEKIGAHVAFKTFASEMREYESRGSGLTHIDSELLEKMKNALPSFGEQMAGFRSIGDLKDDQVVYDIANDRWVILDWTDGHRLSIKKSAGQWARESELTAVTKLFTEPAYFRIVQTAEGLRCDPFSTHSPAFTELCQRVIRAALSAQEKLVDALNLQLAKTPTFGCAFFKGLLRR